MTLRLDDAPAEAALIAIMHCYFANGVAEGTNRNCLAYGFIIRNPLMRSGRSRKQGFPKGCWSPVGLNVAAMAKRFHGSCVQEVGPAVDHARTNFILKQ